MMCKKKYYVSYVRGLENYFFCLWTKRQNLHILLSRGLMTWRIGEKKIYDPREVVSYRLEEKKFYVHLHGSAVN